MLGRCIFVLHCSLTVQSFDLCVIALMTTKHWRRAQLNKVREGISSAKSQMAPA